MNKMSIKFHHQEAQIIPCSFLPSVATDNKKQIQCLEIVSNRTKLDHFLWNPIDSKGVLDSKGCGITPFKWDRESLRATKNGRSKV